MMRLLPLPVAILLALAIPEAPGIELDFRHELARVNRRITGQVLDFSHNHGADHRIWSDALCEKRDMYVYLPPCYDSAKKYPLLIYLHGAFQDEHFFLTDVVQRIDRAMADGDLPPMIVAAPDGSLLGRPSLFHVASFFANSDAGRYEDYVMQDVWDFLMKTFPIRPEREAHALFGVSAGGSAAFAHAIKHKDKVKIAIGFMPPLNLRWVDCHGHYESSFSPCCWGWREKLHPLEVVGHPFGVLKIRFSNFSHPLVGNGPDAIAKLSQFNPIEMIDRYDLKPGELDLYAAYGGMDEFNVTAQADSFLFRAKERGLTVESEFDPRGRHNAETAWRLLPGAIRWAAPRLAPYSPASMQDEASR